MMNAHFGYLKAIAAALGAVAFALAAPAATAQQDRQDDYYDDQTYDQQDQDYNQDYDEDYDSRGETRRDRDRSGADANQQYQQDRSQQGPGFQGYEDRPGAPPRPGQRQEQQGYDSQNPSAALGVSVTQGRQGVRVRQAARNSPAAEAGLRPGDEIVSVNGQSVQRVEELVQIVDRQRPGEEIELQILRDGRRQTVTANLERRREAFGGRLRADAGRSGSGILPPWGDDQVMQHVNALERQVQRMQQEIQDLRSMLGSDPSGRRLRTNRQSGAEQASYSDSEFDQRQEFDNRDRSQQSRANLPRDQRN